MKKQLKYITWIIVLIALAASVVTTYILVSQRDTIRDDIRNAVIAELRARPYSSPPPKKVTQEQVNKAVDNYFQSNPVKNGSNGSNATNMQVEEAVNKYFKAHPVKNGKDAPTPKNGRTPMLRCTGRWEVRYSVDESWQLLNGQSVQCSIGIN